MNLNSIFIVNTDRIRSEILQNKNRLSENNKKNLIIKELCFIYYEYRYLLKNYSKKKDTYVNKIKKKNKTESKKDNLKN